MDQADKELIARHTTKGRRGDKWAIRLFYIVSAAFCLGTAAAYLPPVGQIPHQLDVIGYVMPVTVWAWLWVIVAVALVISAWSQKAAKIAVPLFAALLASLAASFLTEQFAEDVTRAWVSAKNYVYLWALMMIGAYLATRLALRPKE